MAISTHFCDWIKPPATCYDTEIVVQIGCGQAKQKSTVKSSLRGTMREKYEIAESEHYRSLYTSYQLDARFNPPKNDADIEIGCKRWCRPNSRCLQ
jgi:hypothetical protein